MESTSLTITERVRAFGADLTSAERRVAEILLEAPQTVGFGTVADLAKAASVGAATVVRLSGKLGFDGYTELQSAVQAELMHHLRPAVERISTVTDDPFADHAATEVANVQRTLAAVDREAFSTLVGRLADLDRMVAVLAGDDQAGVADQFVNQLLQIRGDVVRIHGSQVAVDRQIAVIPTTATVLAIDLRRYERWVLESHALLVDRGVWSAAVSDRALSPLANRSEVAFDVQAASLSPFDSHVGTLALLNMIMSAVAVELKETARVRLEAIEAVWNQHHSLDGGAGR